MYGLVDHDPGEQLAGATIVSRSGSSALGAYWRVQLPCGHEQVEAGGRLRYIDRQGDRIRCQLCDWKGKDRRLRVLVAIVAAGRVGARCSLSAVCRVTGLHKSTVQSAVTYLIRQRLVNWPDQIHATDAGRAAAEWRCASAPTA